MSKGGDFERIQSRLISLWLTNNQSDNAVWHTSGSGGRATNRKKNNKANNRYDYGDIRPDDDCVNCFFDLFNLELKTGYAKITKSKGKVTKTMWSFNDILDSKQGLPLFYDFWSQSCVDANESQREPMLIFRRTGRLACIAMHQYIFTVLCRLLGEPHYEYITINCKEFDAPVVVCNAQTFYDWSVEKIMKPATIWSLKKIIGVKNGPTK